jgi:hypothetical protein
MRARDNPFATARIHQIRYRLPDGLAWEELLARLKSMNWRGAIVGPEGAGKTTLLEDFEPRLRERGFELIGLRLTREEPRLSSARLAQLASLDSRHIILFDGAEQLGRWAWWRFLRGVRRTGGLLVTSHRPGLLPTLLECRTAPELLAEIVANLLNKTPEACRARAGTLYHKHRGNLREALRELYDVWSSQATGSSNSSSRVHRHTVSYASSLAGPEYQQRCSAG